MIEPPASPTAVLVFEGELETQRWEEFRDRIIGAAGDGVEAIVVDLGGVTFFDSSAIRALLGARLVLEPRGVAIYLHPCSPIVARVIEVTGIDQHFPPPPPGIGPSDPPADPADDQAGSQADDRAPERPGVRDTGPDADEAR